MKFIIVFIAIFFCIESYATIWRVGPTRTHKYCSQVASLVQNGDTVEIDFATYINDSQVIWNKNNLHIIGVGGRPRLQAGSKISNDNVNGKGIFVISGSNVIIDNIEFANASVVDNNGAGIRQEGPNLLVHHCKFTGNEMGILCGAIANCTIIVEYSEFLNGGSATNPGYQHNIYIGHSETFISRYNFSYNAIAEGHELKSRANNNFIIYNTIANYESEDSRNIDLPNGGTALIIGNVIEQGPNSANTNILAFGKEGLTNTAPHELWIVNNTFVNKKNKGSFVDINTGTRKLFLKNNILAGAKTGGLIIGTASLMDTSNSIVTDDISTCGFVDAAKNDYHLSSNSPAIDAGTAIAANVEGFQLIPDKMYKDTCNFEIRIINNSIDIGAYEFNSGSSINEIVISKSFSIYPNPANDLININLTTVNQLQKVQIYNSNGKLIKEESIINFGTIDISDIPVGQYIICLKNSGNKAIKLIKIQ